MNKNLLGGLVLVGIVAVGIFIFLKPAKETYNPAINPDEFSTTINNPYFTLVPGTKFIYEAKKSEGIERIEVTVLNETKTVMGVETVIVHDQVFLDGSLIEDTLDWYAQDAEGNVWYFGEETAEYEEGVQTSTHGAWEAGLSGALPGIVMKATPAVGDSYYQEYFAGIAEDRADVLSIDETVTVPYGTFDGCVKTFDYTPLDPDSLEHKYYCTGVGWTTLEVDTKNNERTELVSVLTGVVTPPAMLTPSVPRSIETGMPVPATQGTSGVSGESSADTVTTTIITEDEAKTIALKAVPGTVTAIGIEDRLGKQVYVVEVDADSGPETDVIIDMKTGTVLATEV